MGYRKNVHVKLLLQAAGKAGDVFYVAKSALRSACACYSICHTRLEIYAKSIEKSISAHKALSAQKIEKAISPDTPAFMSEDKSSEPFIHSPSLFCLAKHEADGRAALSVKRHFSVPQNLHSL